MQVRNENIASETISTDRLAPGNLNPNVDLTNANVNAGMAAMW